MPNMVFERIIDIKSNTYVIYFRSMEDALDFDSFIISSQFCQYYS